MFDFLLVILVVCLLIKLNKLFGIKKYPYKMDEEIRKETIDNFLNHTAKTQIEDIIKKEKKDGKILNIKIIKMPSKKNDIQNKKEVEVKKMELNVDFEVSDNIKNKLLKINFDQSIFLLNTEDIIEDVIDMISDNKIEELKNIVTNSMYDKINKKIVDMANTNMFIKMNLISILSKKITSISFEKKNININVAVDMEQIIFFVDKDNKIIHGSNKKINKIKEEWVFSRNTTINNDTSIWLVNNIINL